MERFFASPITTSEDKRIHVHFISYPQVRPFLFSFSREDEFCIVPIKPLHLSLLRFLTIILRKSNDLERFMPHILFTLFRSSVLVHPTSTGLG